MRGEHFIVYIELPDGYDVEDIILSSLLLNGEVPVGEWPWEIDDDVKAHLSERIYNNDDPLHVIIFVRICWETMDYMTRTASLI